MYKIYINEEWKKEYSSKTNSCEACKVFFFLPVKFTFKVIIIIIIWLNEIIYMYIYIFKKEKHQENLAAIATAVAIHIISVLCARVWFCRCPSLSLFFLILLCVHILFIYFVFFSPLCFCRKKNLIFWFFLCMF